MQVKNKGDFINKLTMADTDIEGFHAQDDDNAEDANSYNEEVNRTARRLWNVTPFDKFGQTTQRFLLNYIILSNWAFCFIDMLFVLTDYSFPAENQKAFLLADAFVSFFIGLCTNLLGFNVTAYRGLFLYAIMLGFLGIIVELPLEKIQPSPRLRLYLCVRFTSHFVLDFINFYIFTFPSKR